MENRKKKAHFRQCPIISDPVKQEPKGDPDPAGPGSYSVLRGVSEEGKPKRFKSRVN